MAKTNVFVSYDFENDGGLKESLLSQARQPESPFVVSEFSQADTMPDGQWAREAQRAIDSCDVVVVLIGHDTHSAPGVLKEIGIANGYKKRIFQLRPQNQRYGPIDGAGEMHLWYWKKLKKLLA